MLSTKHAYRLFYSFRFRVNYNDVFCLFFRQRPFVQEERSSVSDPNETSGGILGGFFFFWNFACSPGSHPEKPTKIVNGVKSTGSRRFHVYRRSGLFEAFFFFRVFSYFDRENDEIGKSGDTTVLAKNHCSAAVLPNSCAQNQIGFCENVIDSRILVDWNFFFSGRIAGPQFGRLSFRALNEREKRLRRVLSSAYL